MTRIKILGDDNSNPFSLDPGEEVVITRTTFYPPPENTTWFFPGAESSTTFYADQKGPLSSALENPFESVTSLQYPRDLNSSRKGHSVQFTMFETKTGVLKEAFEKITGSILQPPENGPSNEDEERTYVQRGREFATRIYDGAKEVAGQLSRGENPIPKELQGSLQGTTNNVKNIPSAYVQLYMPDSVQFEYTSQYENFTMMDALGSIPLVGAAPKAITSIIDKGGNTAARAFLNYAGYVFNPQQQMMFEGIDFRHYAMAFTFTPYSREETETVKKIIRTFREHAAPTIVRAAAGFFFNPPSVFQIKYIHNGIENEYLPKLKRCVLENVSVDYTPNGWTAFGDGSPVQISMALSFREIELVDRVDIQNNF